MRRVVATVVLLVLLAGCGSAAHDPTVSITPLPRHAHALTVCASQDCGPYQASLNWKNQGDATTTGYTISVNGNFVVDTPAPPYTMTGMDCSKEYAVSIQPHGSSGARTGALVTTRYWAPACAGVSSSCTMFATSLAQVVTDSSSAPDGAVICLADGDYGTLTLTAARSAYVTIRAQNGPGHVVLNGLQINSTADFLKLDSLVVQANTALGTSLNGGTAPSNIQITNTDSEGFQVSAGAQNLLFDHDFSHDGPYGWLLNGSFHPTPGGCCSTANFPAIQNVTIENSEIANPVADAFQVKGFNGVTIQNNDIWSVYQNGQHNDGLQTVHGGSNITFTHNWLHDGNVELFIIKDGTIQGVTYTDNLDENNLQANNPPCGGCGTSVSGSIVGPYNVTFERNTIVNLAVDFLNDPDLNGLANGNSNYLAVQNIAVDHNVMTQFKPDDADSTPTPDTEGVFLTAMTEDYNVFGSVTSAFINPMAAHDTVNNNPTFNCSPTCGGLLVNDDYELASNPNGIGIDWNPANQSYGPA